VVEIMRTLYFQGSLALRRSPELSRKTGDSGRNQDDTVSPDEP
jgi:hypothetical protein